VSNSNHVMYSYRARTMNHIAAPVPVGERVAVVAAG